MEEIDSASHVSHLLSTKRESFAPGATGTTQIEQQHRVAVAHQLGGDCQHVPTRLACSIGFLAVHHHDWPLRTSRGSWCVEQPSVERDRIHAAREADRCVSQPVLLWEV